MIEADVSKVDFTRLKAQRLGTRPPAGRRADVKESLPRTFIFEKTGCSMRSSPTMSPTCQKLSRAGYETALHRMNSEDHCIAREHTRIVIVSPTSQRAPGTRAVPAYLFMSVAI
jgi:hypothetical protein